MRRLKDKLYLIWLILISDFAALIVVKGDQRIIAHNMDNKEVHNSIKQLEETIGQELS